MYLPISKSDMLHSSSRAAIVGRGGEWWSEARAEEDGDGFRRGGARTGGGGGTGLEFEMESGGRRIELAIVKTGTAGSRSPQGGGERGRLPMWASQSGPLYHLGPLAFTISVLDVRLDPTRRLAQ